MSNDFLILLFFYKCIHCDSTVRVGWFIYLYEVGSQILVVFNELFFLVTVYFAAHIDSDWVSESPFAILCAVTHLHHSLSTCL